MWQLFYNHCWLTPGKITFTWLHYLIQSSFNQIVNDQAVLKSFHSLRFSEVHWNTCSILLFLPPQSFHTDRNFWWIWDFRNRFEDLHGKTGECAWWKWKEQRKSLTCLHNAPHLVEFQRLWDWQGISPELKRILSMISKLTRTNNWWNTVL